MTTKKPHKGGRVPTRAERKAAGQRSFEMWLDAEDWATLSEYADRDWEGNKSEAIRAAIALIRAEMVTK